MKLRNLIFLLAAGVACLSLFLAAQPARRSYDVSTIKPGADCGTPRPGTRGGPGPDGTFRLNCTTLEALIVMAYDRSGGVVTPTSRRIPVVGGPDWIRSERFDIVAKGEGNPTQEEMMGPMMQALLAERFRLALRREAREGPVYFLTVDKGGLKIQPRTGPCVPIIPAGPINPGELKQLIAQAKAKGKSNPDGCGMRMGQSGQNRIVEFNGTTMAEFAKNLERSEVDRPVLDRTGLSAMFNVHLEYAREAAGAAAAEVLTGPTLFTALQEQLGLRLESGRGPSDVLVVERAERPSEN